MCTLPLTLDYWPNCGNFLQEVKRLVWSKRLKACFLKNGGYMVKKALKVPEEEVSSRKWVREVLRQIIIDTSDKVSTHVRNMRNGDDGGRLSDPVDVASRQTQLAIDNEIAKNRAKVVESALAIVAEIDKGWNFHCLPCGEKVDPEKVVSRMSMLCPACQAKIK